MNITDPKTIEVLNTLRLQSWSQRCTGGCAQCLASSSCGNEKCAEILSRVRRVSQ